MRRREPKRGPVHNVLIADDYPFFRRGLRMFIEEQPDLTVVGEAGTTEELVQLVETARPHIVLLDLNLDGGDGVSVVESIRNGWPDVGVIAFVTPDDADGLAVCIENGVDGCIVKNADPPLILSAIRAVSAGESWLQREMTGKLFQELRRARQAERERAAAPLSDRETEILRLLAEGLRNSQIAQRLFISERTVKVHVANIFGKLGLHDRVQATRYAIRNGLVRV
ncbi:MAG: response regulator transcription factor [Armatimonadota bacterium]|nr:MAG: response regulator transcription factor [Armatimonadota bacterium]